MRKRSRFRIKTIEFFVVYPKLDVPPLSLSCLLFFLYKSLSACTLNETSPFLTCFVLPLQEFVGMYSKCNFPLPHVFPQPPFPLKREPTASAPRGDTLSTRIDYYRSLFMSLVRGRKESKLVRSLVLFVKLGVRFLAALRLVLRLLSCIFRV